MTVGPMTESQRTLVLENMRFADWFIYQNYSSNPAIAGFAQEDLRQTGYLALCKAAMLYDGRVKFQTYAQKVLRSSLADYCTRMLSGGTAVSLDEEFGAGGGVCSRYSFFAAPEAQKAFDEVEARDLIDRCKRRYSGITRKGIEAIELQIQGYSSPEIAKIYGCGPNEVRAWVSRARQKLRSDLGITAAVS